MPKSTKVLGAGACWGCKGLAAVTLQEGLETIGANCFAQSAVKEVVIPKTAKAIGENAFAQCEALTTVIFTPGS